MNPPANILLVDDEVSVLRYIKTLLEIEGYLVETATSGEQALERIERQPAPNLVVLDMIMPGMDGLETLERCRRSFPQQKVVVMSCVGDTGKVVEAIKLGASDYLAKPFQLPQLQAMIRRALDSSPQPDSFSDEASFRDAEAVEALDHDMFFVAASPVMRHIRAQVALIAKVDVPVLLLGESGVGKEIVARLIHKMSLRSHRSMVKVNCAALPAELLESELFGYESGAFTGAGKSKPGKFELAHKGTILLDEIGEMSAALQAKLLHVLQDGEFSRLGGRANVRVHARILAATNIDVHKAMMELKLREDLYYRLNAFTLTIPPLRERFEEIPLLLSCFMNQMAQQFAKSPRPISERLIRQCMRYHWPGNLRELSNFVKRYLVLEQEDLVLEELESKAKKTGEQSRGGTSSAVTYGGLKGLVRSLKDDAEAREISRVLEDVNWNRRRAAAQLHISYKALLYKIKQHGLSPGAEPEVGLGAANP
jgi:DNA-binding NtrC family response regulator